MLIRAGVASVASLLCVPYGYTVTLWCAGAITMADHGLPSRLEVVLFAAGAIAAFLLLGAVGRRHLSVIVPMPAPATLVANVFPVVLAVLLATIPFRGIAKALAFPMASFVATLVYVIALAGVVRLTPQPPRVPRPGP